MSFDLDDTFYDNWPYIVEAEQFLLTYIAEYYPLAAHLTRKEWFTFKKQALKEQAELAHDVGKLRAVTLTKAFIAAGLPTDEIPDAVTDCYDVFYAKRSDFTVRKTVHKTLKRLAAKIPLVAITNGNVDCHKIGIAHYFRHILQAGPHGRMKPDSDMFNETSKLLNIPAKHILHVGDNLEKDVMGAINAGFSAAWYADNRKMRMQNETDARLLPHIQLKKIKELKKLI